MRLANLCESVYTFAVDFYGLLHIFLLPAKTQAERERETDRHSVHLIRVALPLHHTYDI